MTLPNDDCPHPAPSSVLPPPTLSVGEVLAGRFRVVRFLAQGGMGEVWEAEDLEFPGERVALKTVRPEIAGDAWALARFRREIQLGRKVTHPNVCRVFDLFHHRPTSTEHSGGPREAVTFLAMELLAGETLAERLQRAGRVLPSEALPIARQLAAGLGAAHAAGIVHGDFKSGNVILVGSGEARRAVITDFGLARPQRGEKGGETTASGDVAFAGTPGYMAPEQIAGGGPTPEGDVYALGVVLYEMVTGALPQAGAGALAAAVERVTGPPPSPRAAVPDLPAPWERVIVRCLARDPADRFARPQDVARALEGHRVAASPRVRRRRLVVAAALALLAVAAVGWWQWRPSGPLAPGQRRAVAVLGFKNSGGRPETEWLSVALGEMLATELGAGGALRVIPAETVARARVDLALSDFDALSPETLARLRRNLGVDLVVLGSYVALPPSEGGALRVDLRLQDTRAGETLASLERVGSQARLFDLVTDAGAELRRSLGVEEASAAAGSALRATFPQDAEAARLYAEGLERLRRFDVVEARDLLVRAVARSPDQPLAHAALAAAWAELGYDERARAEAQKAFDTSSGLPREQRLLIEGQLREVAGEWPRAVEVYRSLHEFFPDSLEYGLRLVDAQLAAGESQPALQTVERLRALPAPAGEDPRLDLAAAHCYEAVSDFTRQREAAARAATKGAAAGARLLVARARIAECWALRSLGQLDQAAPLCEQARAIFVAAGDRGGAANAVNNLGILVWQRGDLERATGLYQQALSASHEIGDQRGAARALNNLAIVRWQQGDLGGAREMYERVIAVYRETGNRRGLASTLSNLGIVQKSAGDLGAAQRTDEEALALRRELGDRQGEAVSLNNLAAVASDQGDLETAHRLYGQALAIFDGIGERSGAADAAINLAELDRLHGDLDAGERGLTAALATKRAIGDRTGIGNALSGLADVARLRGDLAGAEAKYSEARAARVATQDGAAVAETDLALARLAVARGDANAAAALRRLLQRDEPNGAARAAVELAVATAELERGARVPAAAALDAALAAAGKTASPVFLAEATILRGRLLLRGDQAGEGRRLLESGVAEAHRLGVLELELDGDLALADSDLAVGRRDAARRRLAAVRDAAGAHGLGALAGQADRRLRQAG